MYAIIDAMVHAVYALRGVVAPLVVAIPKIWRHSDDGEITDKDYAAGLEKLGRLVAQTAARLRTEGRPQEIRTVA
jgi:hypothetical protein